MFDIEEYYKDYNKIQSDKPLQLEVENIDVDIYNDIDNLIKNRFDNFYLVDKFKYNKSGIDIIHPRIIYNGGKGLIKGADYIRFLLSIYPQKGELENINKIVLRPRHIEIGNIELMSLYIRYKKILVIYLHHPHLYSVKDSKFNEYSEFIPFHLTELSNKNLFERMPQIKEGNDIRIPPLWYMISIISHSSDNLIDKFFIKKPSNSNSIISQTLDEISFFYFRHGF